MKKERDMIRTQKMVDTYRAHRRTSEQTEVFVFDFEVEEVIKEYPHWTIITNKFPYDAVLQKHHMLVPKRFFGTPQEMNDKERVELEGIKQDLGGEYDGLFENLPHKRSVPAHFHIHLFLWAHVEDITSESAEGIN